MPSSLSFFLVSSAGALTVWGLVVNDGDLRILEMVEDVLANHDALLVVTAWVRNVFG